MEELLIDSLMKARQLADDGEFEEALKSFAAVLEANPSYIEARYYYGACLASLEKYDEAIEQMSQIVENLNEESIEPKLSNVLLARALLYQKNKEYGNAMGDLQRAIEIDPKHPLVAYHIQMLDAFLRKLN